MTEEDRLDLEARCRAAWPELQYAPRFDWVIPNHDGEASPNWDVLGYPMGDALHALQTFVALLDGKQPSLAEQWPAALTTL